MKYFISKNENVITISCSKKERYILADEAGKIIPAALLSETELHTVEIGEELGKELLKGSASRKVFLAIIILSLLIIATWFLNIEFTTKVFISTWLGGFIWIAIEMKRAPVQNETECSSYDEGSIF